MSDAPARFREKLIDTGLCHKVEIPALYADARKYIEHGKRLDDAENRLSQVRALLCHLAGLRTARLSRARVQIAPDSLDRRSVQFGNALPALLSQAMTPAALHFDVPYDKVSRHFHAGGFFCQIPVVPVARLLRFGRFFKQTSQFLPDLSRWFTKKIDPQTNARRLSA